MKTELLDSAVRTIDKDALWHCVPSQLQKCLETTFADGQYSDEDCGQRLEHRRRVHLQTLYRTRGYDAAADEFDAGGVPVDAVDGEALEQQLQQAHVQISTEIHVSSENFLAKVWANLGDAGQREMRTAFSEGRATRIARGKSPNLHFDDKPPHRSRLAAFLRRSKKQRVEGSSDGPRSRWSPKSKEMVEQMKSVNASAGYQRLPQWRGLERSEFVAHWVGQLGRTWSAILGYARRQDKTHWQKKQRREHQSLPLQTKSEGTGVTFEGGEGGSSEVTSEGSEDGGPRRHLVVRRGK